MKTSFLPPIFFCLMLCTCTDVLGQGKLGLSINLPSASVYRGRPKAFHLVDKGELADKFTFYSSIAGSITKTILHIANWDMEIGAGLSASNYTIWPKVKISTLSQDLENLQAIDNELKVEVRKVSYDHRSIDFPVQLNYRFKKAKWPIYIFLQFNSRFNINSDNRVKFLKYRGYSSWLSYGPYHPPVDLNERDKVLVKEYFYELLDGKYQLMYVFGFSVHSSKYVKIEVGQSAFLIKNFDQLSRFMHGVNLSCKVVF